MGETRTGIYLQSVSGRGVRSLISTTGGTEPRWTRGGREIVFLSGTSMMSVSVNLLTGEVGVPVKLFETADLVRDIEGRTHSYDVTADGKRFLVLRRVERPAAQPLVVVLKLVTGHDTACWSSPVMPQQDRLSAALADHRSPVMAKLP
ncbi:MAG: hypothetical protein ACRENB_12015 [Gemmatimonadales bacterium]